MAEPPRGGNRGMPPQEDVARILAQILMSKQMGAPQNAPPIISPKPMQPPPATQGWQGEGSMGSVASALPMAAKMAGAAPPPQAPMPGALPMAVPPMQPPPPQQITQQPLEPPPPAGVDPTGMGIPSARPDVLQALRQWFAKNEASPDNRDWRSAMDQAQWARQGQ